MTDAMFSGAKSGVIVIVIDVCAVASVMPERVPVSRISRED